MRGCVCARVGAVWLHGIPGVYVREAGALALARLVLVFYGPVCPRVHVRNCVQVSGTHWVGSLDELGRFQCRVCVSAQNSSSVPLQEALCCFLAAFAVLWRVLLRAPSGREHFNRFSLTQIFHHLSFIAV